MSGLTNPIVKMRIWWEAENSWDGAVLQYTTDGGATWQNVGHYKTGVNWYNDTTINGNPGGQQVGWTGTASNIGSKGWVTAQHTLKFLAGGPRVRFRMAFGSDGSIQYDGVAFDDFVIKERPTLSLGPDRFFCPGDSIVLTYTSSEPMVKHKWFPTGDTTPTLTVFYPGTYILQATDADGVTVSDTIVVATSPSFVELGPDRRICEHTSTFLTFTSNVTLPQSILWSTGETTPVILVSQPGTYYVFVEDSLGCIVKDSVRVFTVPAPYLSLEDSVQLCMGQSYALVPRVDSTVVAFEWNTGATTPILNVTTEGTYILEVTSLNGCKSADTVYVKVLPLPIVNLGEDAYYCNVTSVVLDPGSNGIAYQWSTGQTTPTITVNTSGTYWVVVTDANGCQNRDTITIGFAPEINVDLGPDIVQCGSVTLTAPYFPGASYLWSNGATTRTITVYRSGTYIVQVSTPFGCYDRDTINVTILDGLTADFTTDQGFTNIPRYQPILFIDNTIPVPDQWLWDFGDGSTSTLQYPTHAYADSGTYVVTLYVQRNGYCPDTVSKIVVISNVVSIESFVFRNGLSVYPNPVTTDEVWLKGELTAPVSELRISLISPLGETIWKKSISRPVSSLEEKIAIPQTPGFYLLKVEGQEWVVYKKLLKL